MLEKTAASKVPISFKISSNRKFSSNVKINLSKFQYNCPSANHTIWTFKYLNFTLLVNQLNPVSLYTSFHIIKIKFFSAYTVNILVFNNKYRHESKNYVIVILYTNISLNNFPSLYMKLLELHLLSRICTKRR